MSIPATITAELANLEAQVAAATPLNQAPRATVDAIRLNAGQLVNDVQGSLIAANVLDTWVAPADPAVIVTGFLAVASTATDQASLSLLRGVVGRAFANINLIPA